MDLFLSFLTVPVIKSNSHLGYENGWTKYKNVDCSLIISGGVVDYMGIEYLDDIQYGKNLDNKYNNYVNPFYIFDILNDEGKQFFLDYYKDEIKETLDNIIKNIELYKSKIHEAQEAEKTINDFLSSVK